MPNLLKKGTYTPVETVVRELLEVVIITSLTITLVLTIFGEISSFTRPLITGRHTRAGMKLDCLQLV